MTEEDKGGRLKQRYGSLVELEDADGKARQFRILAELTLDGRDYAVLQSDAQRKDGDIEVFRVAADEDGEPQLETVEDDEEWESVAEAYDDLQFGSDERP